MKEIDYEKLKQVKVLYVEDNEDIRSSLVGFLEIDIEKLYVAIDGEEGLKLFKEYSPDIVVTDIQMPKMNGLKMAKAIKEIDRDIPIIVTTAFNDMEYFMESINIGIDKYITKPIDVEDLMEAIYKSSMTFLKTKEIEAKNKFIQYLLDKSPNFIFTTDGTNICYINKQFLNFLKFSSLKEFQNKNTSLFDYIISLDTKKSIEFNFLNSLIDKNEQALVYLKLPYSMEKVYLISCNFFIGENNYLITLSDVTQIENERKEVKDKLENVKKDILQKQKMLEFQSRQAQMGQMISAIGHQWKQPLNIIAGSIANLDIKIDFGELNEEGVKECIKTTNKQIKFMSQTLDDFRNFFKPEKEKVIFDIKNTIEKTEKLISSLLKKIDIKPIINGESFEINGYENEFCQVILNILSNAKDAILEKQNLNSDFVGKIEINLNSDNKSIEILDNAGGIAEEIIDKVFEPYISTKGEKGTGIGLNISKTIIENMDGNIKVENKKYGANFIITF